MSDIRLKQKRGRPPADPMDKLMNECMKAYIEVEDWAPTAAVRRVRPSGYRSHLDDSVWSTAIAELPVYLTSRASRVRTALWQVHPWVPELEDLIRHYVRRGSIKGFILARGELPRGKGTAFGMLRITEEDVVKIWWTKFCVQLRKAIQSAPIYTDVE